MLFAAALCMLALPVATPPQPASAQTGCVTETEPNDTEQTATPASGPWCVEGKLPRGDQDLAVWTMPVEDITTRWTITLDGVTGTETLLQFFVVTTEPDQAILLVERLRFLELIVASDDTDPVIMADVLLPAGRYLVAIARSSLPGGGEPEATAYRYAIEPGEPWPSSADVEPNDDASTAQELTDSFETGGDRRGSSSDFFTWTVSDAGRWDLALAAPLGETVSFGLQDAEGLALDSANAPTEARLFDLQLDAGTYRIRVPESGAESRPYVLAASPATADGDPEPNGDTVNAVPIEDGVPTRGRLAKTADRDRFVLTVPSGEPMLRDARMLWRSGSDRTLCLLDDSDADVVCRRAAEGLALPNLFLAPGQHTFDVSGTNDPSDTYLLRVDVVGPAMPDFETEPNEKVEGATLIDPSLGMTARGGPEDHDFFHLRTEGEPQLWQIDLAGSEIDRAELVRASDASLASADITSDGSSATFADLYLVPGDHWLRVASTGPEYSISTTPLGPPDPDGEREPNDGALHAERYAIGSRRVGRLPTPSDHDLYRFTLAAPQHIRLELVQPADAATGLRLWAGDQVAAELADLPVGEGIAYDAWLPAGDHIVELYPEQVSEGWYELKSEQLDPYAPVVDKEPDDDRAWARPIPATLSWQGAAVDPDDEDWYLLPAAAADVPLRIDVEGGDARVRLLEIDTGPGSGRPIKLDRLAGGSHVTAEALTPGVPMLLMVAADGGYEVGLDGAGLTPGPEPADLEVGISWQLTHDSVAAYWPDEQVIEGSIELANPGPTAFDVSLEAITSHHAWRATPASTEVSLPAGGSVSVPVSVVAGVDAWGSEPVLVSALATSSAGGQASASTVVLPSGDSSPVNPRAGWSVPSGLLGGLNAASVALGAQVAGTLDADQERRLFDGVTPEGPTGQASQLHGNGFSVFVRDHAEQLPIDVEVDLVGHDPVPVVGTIINPQASQGQLSEVPRDFELLLSTDGRSYEPVLRDTLSPLRIDQAFVLPAPVPATHAKLRIWSKYLDQAAYISLGEWKVVVKPGHAIGDEPFDLADPELGGHVVTFEPFDGDPETSVGMLDEASDPVRPDLADGRTFEVILGFMDGRAAQVDELGWRDPEPSDPDTRLERVEVFTSLLGPTGPWRSQGTWELQRKPDGSVAAFDPGEPMWVRYLRLSGRARADVAVVELPGELRALERHTDDRYQSIAGEWGYRSRSGPYEQQEPTIPASNGTAADASDDPLEATELMAGMEATDRVEINVDEDWFWFDVPAEHDTLELVVSGRPSVAVGLTLLDDAGEEQVMSFRTEPDGTVRYQAEVDPERRYRIGVQQPPFSAVFAFDTSSSIDPFLDMVMQGMRSFLADVRPGREVVTVMPFEEAPLVDGWQDDPYLLQDAFENHVVEGGGSSGAEAALIDASARLAEREGARAILLVTDAETSTFDRTSQLWSALGRTRPMIFPVHIGAVIDPVGSRQRMQDWAASGSGHYGYPTTFGEMSQAFDRMATWLRRPAEYTLELRTLELLPASLAVMPPPDSSPDGAATALAAGIGVEIILDTSGSMRKKLGKKRRIDVAKASLKALVGRELAEGVPIAIRTFGGPGSGEAAKCATSLSLPLTPLHRDRALATVKRLKATKGTATPIAAALAEVADDLASVDSLRRVVLISDGKETCDGDPAAAIATLAESGIDVRLDIVGFALKDEALKAEMAAWAEAGGGSYHDAGDASELAATITAALRAPFRVYGPDGEPLAVGTVGGDPVALEPDTYRVEVLTEPPVLFDQVELGNGATVTLELPATED